MHLNLSTKKQKKIYKNPTIQPDIQAIQAFSLICLKCKKMIFWLDKKPQKNIKKKTQKSTET